MPKHKLPPIDTESGFLYMVLPEGSNFVKIGYSCTENPDKIVSRYKTSIARPTIFIYACENAKHHESEIFQILERYRYEKNHEHFVRNEKVLYTFFRFVNDIGMTLVKKTEPRCIVSNDEVEENCIHSADNNTIEYQPNCLDIFRSVIKTGHKCSSRVQPV